MSLVLMFGIVGVVRAEVNPVTPSTNDINRTNGWAHVDVSAGVGELTVDFIQPRNFYACFEYRTDGDTSQMTSPTNYNSLVTDGLYPYKCLSTISTFQKTITADQYVEIRMVFGGETDERFDWTKFDVLTAPTKADILIGSGVPGKGLDVAPGLQKPFNPKSQAAGHAGKKK